MSEENAKEFVEPIVIERERDNVPESSEKPIENDKNIDKSDEYDIQKHEIYDSDDPRKAIAEKHARKQREELGFEEDKPDAKEATETSEPGDDPFVTVKVNGKEKQVLQSKVDAAGGLDVYQKRLAAEDRLQEVSLQRKELERRQSELQREADRFKQWQQQQIERLAKEKQSLAAAGTADSQTQAFKPDPQLKELAKQHREALMDGDDDKADELLVQIQQYGTRPVSPPVNVQEIEQRTFNRIQARLAEERQVQERTSAQQDFAKTYNDIVGDERLFQMADQETIRLKQQNPRWSDREIIMQAGENVRRWREEMMGNVGTAPQQNDIEKAAAKRAMSVAKAASGRSPSKPEPKPQTPSQYIESLKAARGQGI